VVWIVVSFWAAFIGGGFVGLFIWFVCFLVFLGVAGLFSAIARAARDERVTIHNQKLRQELIDSIARSTSPTQRGPWS
jgi:hypothetical protein